MKIVGIVAGLLLLVGAGIGLYMLGQQSVRVADEGEMMDDAHGEVSETEEVQEEEEVDEPIKVIGRSVDGRDITAHRFGAVDAEKKVVFAGGIHGGYSWNTSLLMYELIDYFESDSEVIPENVQVTVIPAINPDGLHEVTGMDGRFEADDVDADTDARVAGRFNTNDVDLNRNFDCDWEEEGVWQSKKVSGGDKVFSEPETRTVRDFILEYGPDAVVVYYSAAGGVFASNCHGGILSETEDLTDKYADASGYKAFQSFDFYKITGDMVNWLAKEEIPGISVLLSNHTDTEWSENRKGVEAVLKYYAN